MVLITRSMTGLLVAGCVLVCGFLLPASVSAKTQGEQLICLDPGHQLYGNNAVEPVAPGSGEKKAKVSSGTRGVVTKKPEYVLTLEAAKLLKDKLELLGYRIVMTRESHEVDISNVERAQLCNEVQADMAVRIHADGDSSPKTQGMSLLYPAWTKENQGIFAQSKEAAELILNKAVAATQASSRGVVPRSDLTGFNWSKVPSVLVEMGFMTNPDEDRRLSEAGYLNTLTQGIADGINEAMAYSADGQEVQVPSRIYLPTGAQLYELSNGKFIRTPLGLSPQLLEVAATRGNWGKVSTWVGERWVPLEQALKPVHSVDKQIELRANTPFYRSPSDTQPAGRLSAQKVSVREQWQDWVLIETWLGKMWVME